MYLLFSLTHRIGYVLGLLHLRDFNGIETWANPLLGTAELIEFIRGHLPFLAVASSLLLAVAVVWAVDGSVWMIAAVFLSLASSRALAFHTLIFRTDSFALFYAAAAVALAVAAMKQHGRVAIAFAIGSGVLCGLAMTSKVQIISTIALAPALVLLMMARNNAEAFPDISSRRNLHVSLAAIGTYLFLIGISTLPMPSTFVHTRSSFSNFALCLAGFAAIAAPGLMTRIVPQRGVLYRFLSFANLMALGFAASFLLLWFVMMSPRSGVQFVAALAKVSFLGTIDPALVPGHQSFRDQVLSSPILLLMPALLLAFLALWRPRLASNAELVVLAVIGGLVVASVLWFDRSVMNADAIFTEPLTLSFACIMLAMAWQGGGRAVRAVVAICMALLVFRAVPQTKIWALTDTGYAGYFRESRQILTPYQLGNQQNIENSFRRLFVLDDSTKHSVSERARSLVFKQAADYGFITKQVAFAIPNRGAIDWSRIGVLGEGLRPFGLVRADLWFTTVPAELEGATVYVPPMSAPVPGAAWLARALISCGLYDFEVNAWLRLDADRIRSRSDMEVFAFVPAERRQQFDVPENAPVVAIADRSYVGVPVPTNADGSLFARLGSVEDRFIVIKRRYS
ncbi:hypothetical protein [Bradyrhizobium centrolobii]|nr:hypothetical protein [Bradyrhizobium centrolobii]